MSRALASRLAKLETKGDTAFPRFFLIGVGGDADSASEMQRVRAEGFNERSDRLFVVTFVDPPCRPEHLQ